MKTKEQRLDPIVAGDDVYYEFRFYEEDNDLISVANDTLTFTMTKDALEVQIIDSIPNDEATRNGVHTMLVDKASTNVTVGEWQYEFVWYRSNTNADHHTIQRGYVEVIEKKT